MSLSSFNLWLNGIICSELHVCTVHLKKTLNYLLKFSKLHFLLKFVLQKCCYPEPKPVAGTEARAGSKLDQLRNTVH